MTGPVLFTDEEIRGNASSLAALVAREQTAHWAERGILDLNAQEFTEHLTAQITKLAMRTVSVPMPTDLAYRQHVFGFGEPVPLAITEWREDEYGRNGWFWAHDLAESIGWGYQNLADHLRKMRAIDLEEQRDHDEEVGTLGYDYLNHVPLGVAVRHTEDDGSTSLAGWDDLWLIHTHRLMALMSSSPWSKEFMDNCIPLMAKAMLETDREGAESVPTFQRRTDSMGEQHTEEVGTLADMLAEDTRGLTVEEMARRAIRGPVLDEGDNR